MRTKLLSLSLFIALAPSALYAQESKPLIPPSVVAPKTYENKYDFDQFWKETGLFFTQPLRWQADDWWRTAAVGGTTALATIIDNPVRTTVIKDNQRLFYSAPIVAGRMYGELYTPVILFAGFASYSLITGDRTTRKIGYELGQAALYGGATVYVIKILVGRSRPFVNEGPGHFRPSFSVIDDPFHSFPSGHTAVAFVISTILSRNVEPTWAKVLCYLPAVLTPISRVYQDQHWVSDCVLGGAIGYFFATWVVDQHERNDEAQKEKSAIQLNSIFPLSLSIALN